LFAALPRMGVLGLPVFLLLLLFFLLPVRNSFGKPF
jgi:hypothetical protein